MTLNLQLQLQNSLCLLQAERDCRTWKELVLNCLQFSKYKQNLKIMAQKPLLKLCTYRQPYKAILPNKEPALRYQALWKSIQKPNRNST